MRLLLAACLAGLSSWGCISEDQCQNSNWDCFQCIGGEVRTCTDLHTLETCRPIYLNGPCEYGSKCDIDQETCPDVCIYQWLPPGYMQGGAQCGTVGLRFHGSGALAVGYTVDATTHAERPAVLIGAGYGASWSYVEAPAPRSGCTSERLVQLVLRDAERGFVLSTGTGPDCPPGIYRTLDGGTGWRWLALPPDLAMTADPSARLALATAVSGWLFLSGASPALSLDDGETWQAVPLPLVDPGDGTPVPTSVAHAAPGWDPATDLCMATAGAPSELQCGATDGSTLELLHRFEGPVLGFGWAPLGPPLGWLVTGAPGAAVHRLDGTQESVRPDDQPDGAPHLSAVHASLVSPDLIVISYLQADRFCGTSFLTGPDTGWMGLDLYGCQDVPLLAAVFAQSLSRVFLVGPSTPGTQGPWVRGTIDRYGYVQDLPVTDAPGAGVATTGIAAGLMGPVTPPWSID